MADLPDPSTMSEADLRAEAATYQDKGSQSVQPELKDPAQMSEAELRAEAATYAPKQGIVGGLNAANIAQTGAGRVLLSGGAGIVQPQLNLAQAANKLGSGIAQRLGLIDPKTRAAYDAHVDQKFNAAPEPAVANAIAQHPTVNAAGQMVGAGIPAIAAGEAIGAGATAAGASKLISYGANMLGQGASFGALSAKPGQELSGALGGAAGGVAMGALGGVVAKLAQSSAPAIRAGLKTMSDKAMGYLADPTADAQSNAIHGVVSHFQNAKAVVDKAEDAFRGIPGTFQASDLKGSLDKALADHAAELSPSQRAVLQSASSKLEEPVTTGSLVDIKRGLNNNYQLFHDKQAMSAELGDSYNNVLKSADSQIGTTMKQANQPDLYQAYKDKYNSTLGPLRNMKIDRWANLDPNSPEFATKSQSFFKQMVNTNNPGLIQSLRDTLGPKANTAVSSHFLSMAADSATDAEGSLKVGSLIKTLDKLKDAGAFPEGSQEAKMMDGMRKIALTSQHADVLHSLPVIGSAARAVKNPLGWAAYHAGNILNKLPNSAMGQAALAKIGASTNPDLVTRALETSVELAGAGAGAYQANKISQ